MIFYKTVSAGNDFLHLDTAEVEETVAAGLKNGDNERPGQLAAAMCRRHHGAGADGLVFYTFLNDRGNNHAHARFRIFNRDGGEAELSGNGMAGLSALLFHLGISDSSVTLDTRAGLKTHRLIEKEGNRFGMEIEIGVPDFHNRVFFPFLQQGRDGYQHNGITFYPVSTGNPHAVVLTGEDTDRATLEHMGKELESAPMFPSKTNVELVSFRDEAHCRVFFYERGVGFTQSSSTGSAAVFSVLRRLGRITDTLRLTPYGAGQKECIKISGKPEVCIENSTKIVYKGMYMGF